MTLREDATAGNPVHVTEETAGTLVFSIIKRHEDRAFLAVKCGRSGMGECLFPCWQRPASGEMWKWDGNSEKPTISPSIACQFPSCTRHFTVTNGVAA